MWCCSMRATIKDLIEQEVEARGGVAAPARWFTPDATDDHDLG